MTKTVEITLYQFDELNDKAKEKARENYITNWMSDDWYTFTYDMMKEEGLKYGFNIKDIRFSGFWSQGDGASWCGAVRVKDWIASKPTEYQEHATTQIILALIEEGWVDEIADGSHDLLHLYRDRLMERISVLTEGVADLDLDNGRIAQEAALLADRSDISEELVRTRSHLGHFRSVMASDEPGGRKLNFLLQELSRELNTMGSKTEKAEFSQRVVEMKCELEKIREQVQNIE